MKSCVAASIATDGYDVTFKTSTDNYAIAHCNEQWVVQSVSRIAEIGASELSQYVVIPQPVRVAVCKVVANSEIINRLLVAGQWSGEIEL